MSFREPARKQDDVLEYGFNRKPPEPGRKYTPAQIKEAREFIEESYAAVDVMRRLGQAGRGPL